MVLDQLGVHPAEVVLADAVVSVKAYVQGSVGFGLALVAAALLAQINPVLVPGPLILSGSLLNVLMNRHNWGGSCSTSEAAVVDSFYGGSGSCEALKSKPMTT